VLATFGGLLLDPTGDLWSFAAGSWVRVVEVDRNASPDEVVFELHLHDADPAGGTRYTSEGARRVAPLYPAGFGVGP
jgi:hypothetical protein